MRAGWILAGVGLVLGMSLAGGGGRVGAQGALAGDANGDCRVDGVDFVVVFNHYGQTTSGGVSVGDFNTDGRVDGVDYVILLNHYGQTCQGTPTPTATRTPTPTPGGPTPTMPPIVTGQGIWISQQEIMTRPTSGSAWDSVHSYASRSWGSSNVADQDSDHDIYTLAGALVCARTGQFCDKTLSGLLSAVGTEDNERWLAIGRNMTSYTIAADLLRAKGILNGADLNTIDSWLSSFLTRKLPHNNTGEPIPAFPFASGSNASAQEGAVYAAISAYLGDAAPTITHPYTGETITGKGHLQRVWDAFRTYSCDPTAPDKERIDVTNGFESGWSHATKLEDACAVNPKGTSKEGIRIDGATINDIRRGGNFQWPPGYTQYPWTGLEGYVPAALILHRAGYPAFQVADQAVLRTYEFLWYLETNTTTDWWQPSRAAAVKHIVNVAYGKNFPVSYPTGGFKTIGFTDWTHPNGI